MAALPVVGALVQETEFYLTAAGDPDVIQIRTEAITKLCETLLNTA